MDCIDSFIFKLIFVGNVYVHWLDDVSALVALKNPQNTINAKAALLNKSSRVYRVRAYAEYQKWANQQLQSTRVESKSKKPFPSSESKSTVSKRKSSASTEGSAACSMDLIPEDDENEAETADELPPTKRRKAVEEENESEEVSSTARVFEEENNWP
ncbi:hypothetical protein AVEN_251224-1 [Araneus ventricosus]|uniref:Poly(A)-specific ribonuclease RNA-binding domain-containing protein n=1 Tax=Araneus ventricosus TaxID=182803 RepID=A0A4Y1ZVH7_ARAVE|nr:hypothetical protein AVEN_251224-1 [Araneus ventricosus]